MESLRERAALQSRDAPARITGWFEVHLGAALSRCHRPWSRDRADHIVDPFVSRNSTGTGLVLYIAGVLCEYNQASLSLHANTVQGCCFRINFAHPDRQQWVA